MQSYDSADSHESFPRFPISLKTVEGMITVNEEVVERFIDNGELLGRIHTGLSKPLDFTFSNLTDGSFRDYFLRAEAKFSDGIRVDGKVYAIVGHHVS
jgi:hypothetical protein